MFICYYCCNLFVQHISYKTCSSKCYRTTAVKIVLKQSKNNETTAKINGRCKKENIEGQKGTFLWEELPMCEGEQKTQTFPFNLTWTWQQRRSLTRMRKWLRQAARDSDSLPQSIHVWLLSPATSRENELCVTLSVLSKQLETSSLFTCNRSHWQTPADSRRSQQISPM